MKRILENELVRLKQIEKQIERSINEAPEGTIRCTSCKGNYQYYQGREYISKERKEFISQLAQKTYCKSIKAKVKSLINNMESALKIYREEELENQYRRLASSRKAVVEPLFKPIEDIIKEFESIQYEGKSFDENDMTEYYTIKGERVRSKSEKIIADELYRYGIPYKYEMPVELDIWNRKKIFYPDFTVLNKRTGNKKYIEHLGMMDNQSYCENAMQKIDIYEKNGHLLGDTLLVFHETLATPLNTKVMQKYIEKYLL